MNIKKFIESSQNTSCEGEENKLNISEYTLINILEKKRWLSPPELEFIFGFKEGTQAKWRMKKKIPFSKLGGKTIRYDRHLINKFLEEHNINS